MHFNAKPYAERSEDLFWQIVAEYDSTGKSQYLRGWINYFGIANCYQRCIDLDHWIRRRVRMAFGVNGENHVLK